ncbi:TIM barrel protein [Nocardia sp. CY41]|uniref:TIM barrel protein n=1 Tax=Nocardia sp. CY41 TaxID=2608686 RepID=UPI00135C5ABF|nr:TIM barrel protein [Nocardia sp. CY41]
MKFYSYVCSANTSTIYRRLPVLERPTAAAIAGYSHVESWWPFDKEIPTPKRIREFSRAHMSVGVQLEMINMDAGSYEDGDRGLLSLAGADQRIKESLASLTDIMSFTGCRLVNVPWGNSNADKGDSDDRALDRLAHIAERVGSHDGKVLVEMLNPRENPSYRVTSLHTARELIRTVNARVNTPNVGLLLDTYHLATSRISATEAIADNRDLICHVQVADSPGRGKPGTGTVDFRKVVDALDGIGYAGRIGMEYFE